MLFYMKGEQMNYHVVKLSLFVFIVILAQFVYGQAQANSQPKGIQRIYSGDPVQVTGLQFTDPQSGTIFKTIDLQKYDPFFPGEKLEDLPVMKSDTGFVVYKIIDPDDTPQPLLNDYGQKYSNMSNSKPIGGVKKQTRITVSPQNNWVAVTYEIGLIAPVELVPLVERSKLFIFSSTGVPYWELDTTPYSYSQLKFTKNDSFFAFSYAEAKGFFREKFTGVKVYDISKRSLCYEYEPEEGYMLSESPPETTQDLIVLFVYPHKERSIKYIIINCINNQIYSKEYSLKRIIRDSIQIRKHGIVYKTIEGEQKYDPFN